LFANLIAKMAIGILAYGSLITDPGAEIEPRITQRIFALTPFPVEFARLSASRGLAPTVVPFSRGWAVKAEVLQLSQTTSVSLAKDLLWRREVRKIGSGFRYREASGSNAVLIRDLMSFCGIDQVLYTDFRPNGKLANVDPEELARASIKSVSKATPGRDGITYLMDLIAGDVITEQTAAYKARILELSGARDLSQAREIALSLGSAPGP
jgi:hypothetical protein